MASRLNSTKNLEKVTPKKILKPSPRIAEEGKLWETNSMRTPSPPNTKET